MCCAVLAFPVFVYVCCNYMYTVFNVSGVTAATYLEYHVDCTMQPSNPCITTAMILYTEQDVQVCGCTCLLVTC